MQVFLIMIRVFRLVTLQVLNYTVQLFFLCLCIQRKTCVFMAPPLTHFLIIQGLPYVNYSMEPALLNRRNNLKDEAATGILR